ncbi:MAG: hypothetical protein RLY20_2426 [Verrucomicrobiota bacterium]|jgi:uncharacterized lipoprotein YehR (DUF1307 family)
MKKLLIALVFLVAVVLTVSGCKSHEGSREFIPGKGWQQN